MVNLKVVNEAVSQIQETGPNQAGLFFNERKMLKKILSASLVLLQILTQSASAMEFRPLVQPSPVQAIPAVSLPIASDILKNENPLSVSRAFSFFNISDNFVNPMN